MRNYRFAVALRRSFVLFAVLIAHQVALASPPPPQGPPQAPPGQYPVVASFSIYTLRWLLRAAAEDAMFEHNETNEHKLSWASGAKPTSCGHDCLSAPYFSATQYNDRPNDRVVRMHGHFAFDIDVNNYPFDRRIITPYSITVYCHGWRDGSGEILISTKTGQPYSTDADWAWLEGLIGWATPLHLLSQHVDNRVRAGLGGAEPAQNKHLTACRSLGIEKTPGQVDGEYFTWEKPEPVYALPFPVNTGTVVVDSIKRNETRSNVDPSRGVSFDLFVNGRVLRVPQHGELIIAPDEVLNFFDSQIAIGLDDAESLQVIVNDTLGGAAWHGFDASTGFGQGTHTLVTHRTELVPVGQLPGGFDNGYGPRSNKPESQSIREFEITYTIYAGSPVASNETTGGSTSTSPGFEITQPTGVITLQRPALRRHTVRRFTH